MTQPGAQKVAVGGRPPFAFRVEVPDDWTVFDTAPETWQRSAQSLVDGLQGSERLNGTQRRGAMAILADVADAAQQVGTCVSAVKLARDRERRLFWGSLALTWYNSAPIEPDMAFLKIVAGKRDRQRELKTDLGVALLVRGQTVWLNPLPGVMTEGRTYDTQVYLPIPGTTWTALFSGSTAASAHADLMEKLVSRMALTLVPDLPTRATPRESTSESTPESTPSRESNALRSRLRSTVTSIPLNEKGPTEQGGESGLTH